jgi:ribosome maturation factor RimP
MAAKKQSTAEDVRLLAEPVAKEMGLILWDVVFVKEGPSWFLRITIDKPGGVFIEDCENLSRAVDPLIDELDPAEQEYFLEVSSPGLGRTLRTDEHLAAYIGKPVKVRRYRPDENQQKEAFGVLVSFDGDGVTIAIDGQEILYVRNDISDIKSDDDRDLFGGKK